MEIIDVNSLVGHPALVLAGVTREPVTIKNDK